MIPLLLTPPPAQDPPVFLKWCGSKQALAPHLLSYLLPALAQGGRYFEPFLGSAALFFWLRASGWRGEALLSDLLGQMIICYEQVWLFTDDLSRLLIEIEEGYERSQDKRTYYYYARSRFNSDWPRTRYHAALFLWLNHRGFNGLYRTNKRGEMTTPWGGERSFLPSLRCLEAASLALQGAQLSCEDFANAIACAVEDDVIYADPPYAVGFNGYAGGFTKDDQARLARCLRAAHSRGSTIVASNSDTPEIRELYSWCQIVPVSLSYSVGGGTKEKEGREVILVAKGGKP